MVHFTPAFTVLFCVVSLAVETSTVGAAPLPVNQKTMKVEARGARNKQSPFQGYRKEPQHSYLPRSAVAVRGSSLASRQAAETKRGLRAGALTNPGSRTSKRVFGRSSESAPVSYVAGAESPITGWMVDDVAGDVDTTTSPPIGEETPGETNEDVDRQAGLQYHVDTTLTLSATQPSVPSCSSTRMPASLLQTPAGADDADAFEDAPTVDDGMYHPPSLQQPSPTSIQPLAGTVFRASAGDPIMMRRRIDLYKRSIYHPHEHGDKGKDRKKKNHKAKPKSKPVKKGKTPSSRKTQIQKKNTSKERRSLLVTGNGIDIELGGDEKNHYQTYSNSDPGPLIALQLRRETGSPQHSHGSVPDVHVISENDEDLLLGTRKRDHDRHWDNRDRDHYHDRYYEHDQDHYYGHGHDHDHDHDHDHTHEHVHKRLAPTGASPAAVGKMGILKPVMGLTDTEPVSQLVALLDLASMKSSGPQGSMYFKSSLAAKEEGDDDTPTPPINPAEGAPGIEEEVPSVDNGTDAYLLAPSTSASGLDLQMVEMEPFRFASNESQWKHVEFQVTLTNAHNEPHLYCATVRPPASLRMELCDGEGEMNSTQVNDDGASRRFLFDESTGEVIPYKPDAQYNDGNATTTNATTTSTTSTTRRASLGAARLTMESSGPQAVKLVFFTQQGISREEDSKPTTPMTSDFSPSSFPTDDLNQSEAGEPPLLESDQPSYPPSTPSSPSLDDQSE
ncbi:hypothetical protein CBS101457_001736 [Exobasidium rhododendri]|nr:hypothetical protein CBS101457_001736 [Exobasidium rhododendri]